jgi:mRNA interferase HicA
MYRFEQQVDCASDKNVRYSGSRGMKGSEFVRKVQMLAKKRGLDVRLDAKRGKGSHMTLYFGERMTIIRNPKDELKTGTLHAMCKQLGIEKSEL